MAETLVQPALQGRCVARLQIDHLIRGEGEQAVGFQGILHRWIGRQQVLAACLPAANATNTDR